MRQLIMTKGGRFDIDAIRPRIDAIVNAFDSYLEEYPVKTARTMHGLMGPVPMILDGARVRKEDVKTLVGRAVRAHEMNPKTRGYLSAAAMDALETATRERLALCDQVPVTAVTKVTERIRYNVYYTRRKKSIDWLEQTRKKFSEFLRGRYQDDNALAEAWNEKELKLDTVRFPSRTSKTFTQANDVKKKDVNDFWASIGVEEIAIEEEEDNE